VIARAGAFVVCAALAACRAGAFGTAPFLRIKACVSQEHSAAAPNRAPMGIKTACSAAALIVLGGLLWAAPVRGQAPALEDATFQLVTMRQSGSSYTSVMVGTAFFIDADGTALTNSHVVYRAKQDPARYHLLAIIGREFYSVTLVCASTLPYEPDGDEVILGRDVAQVKLGPSRFPFTRISYRNGGPEYSAHLVGLPRFPMLTFGDDPRPGAAVRIVGYGHIEERLTSTPGERWAATGTVDETEVAGDGTPVFRVVSANRPRLGNSGSPVLDGEGRVVGMWTWNEADNLAFGEAIASSALTPACR